MPFPTAVLAAVVLGLGQPGQAGPARPETAAAYVDSFLRIVEREAWTSDTPEWPSLAEAARRDAAQAEDALATYPILERVIRAIGDHHGGLQVTPEREAEYRRRYGRAWYETSMSRPASQFLARTQPSFTDLHLDNGRVVRVLTAPRLYQNEDGQAYARTLFEATADPEPLICGFILDLRGNIGGTMWPMLAAVSPLLGEGEIGAFTRRTGPPQPWRVVGGASGLYPEPDRFHADFTLQDWRRPPAGRDEAPVAVLFDDGTLSSGEAVATAFSGRPNTRSFGVTTYGLASNNRPFVLSDGTTLLLVTGLYQDRLGRTFPNGLTPDVAIDARSPSENGLTPAAAAARAWLEDRPACRAA